VGPRTWLRLVVSCAVLGLGVGLLLTAGLGADGYATLVDGLSRAFGLDFWVVNVAVGAALVGLAWTRGLVPGPGTVVQPVVVGLVVSAVTGLVAEPDAAWVRATLMVVAIVVLALGVAGYLAAEAGAGPMEAAAIALDPPIPFAWSYAVVQGGGALVGWACGAAVGPGTLVAIVLLGPLVSWLNRGS
jgi:uncharacterized membrane protein YczE